MRCNKEDRYSITSSARASNDGGACMIQVNENACSAN
jgi:hypothetical protein